MRFLMITFDFHPTVGGIQTRAGNYVRNLVKMKNDVVLVHLLNPRVLQAYFGSLSQGDKMWGDKYFGATILRYPSRVKFLLRVFFNVTRALKNAPIDVIHVVSGGTTPIGLLFLFYGKIRGIKTGVSFYGKDVLSSRHNLLDILIMRFSMLFADRIGVNSRATSGLIPKMFRKKVSILYPGMDIQALKMFERQKIVARARAKEKEILFVGRLVWRKGVHELLQAFKMVIREVPKAKLTIVGDGIQREALLKLTKKLGIQSKVEFTGFLVGEELWKKYHECDIFVMPSKETRRDTEGFGMVFLEAGLFKKPSVGTWCGGIPEAVLHKKTGILIPQGDVIALRDALQLLLTNEELAEKLGQNAHNRVVSEFTWKKATLRFLKMFQ